MTGEVVVDPTHSAHRLSFWVRHRFHLALAAIASIGLAIRVGYSARFTMTTPLTGDAFFFYYWVAVQVGRGYGFLNFATLYYDHATPGAHQPPGFILTLAGLYRLGLESPNEMRLALCVVGATTIVLIGLLVGRIVSKRAGLIAAALGAVYPNIWISDTILWSETLVIFSFTLGLCGIYAYHRRPTMSRIALASVGFTILAMTRAEMLALFPLVVIPLVAARRQLASTRRMSHIGIALLLPIVSVGAWSGYNAHRFTKPVLMSTSFGPTALAGACNKVFSGPSIGSLWIPCTEDAYVSDFPHPRINGRTLPGTTNWAAFRSGRYFAKHGTLPPPYWDTSVPATPEFLDESVDSARAQALWWRYITKHANRLPTVVLAREGRVVGLWNPEQQVVIDRVEGRGPLWLLRIAQWMFWVLALASIPGAALWRRRGLLLYPLMAQVFVTVAIAALLYGLTRYRATSEVVLVILAATACDWLVVRLRTKVRRVNEDGAPLRSTTGTP